MASERCLICETRDDCVSVAGVVGAAEPGVRTFVDQWLARQPLSELDELLRGVLGACF